LTCTTNKFSNTAHAILHKHGVTDDKIGLLKLSL